MSRIDLPEDYAVRTLRRNVKESLQSHGEEAIVLAMYHVVRDDTTAERCHCFDDIYQQGGTYDCPDCFGTTFAGGVRQAARVWALFTDAQGIENIDKQGVWTPDNREVQTEALPELLEHDFIVRVSEWDRHHRPVHVEGIYVIDKVDQTSLRTGARYGQNYRDVVGQRASVTRLQATNPIHRFKMTGRAFPRLDGMVR